MTRPSTLFRFAAAALALAGLAACDGREVATPVAVERGDATVRYSANASLAAEMNPEVSHWLARLRAATASFQRLDAAGQAGWETPITGCLELPGTGGMGYHYGNTGLIDGVLDDVAPEPLVYEPQKNGRLRLVAVEYIVPYTAVPRDADAPSLHGVALHHNDDFGLWVLHAWIWKNNPAGLFEDLNPTVSCAFAS